MAIWLVMIKPDAIEKWEDEIILDCLENPSSLDNEFCIQESIRSRLRDVFLIKSFWIDLFCNTNILNILYWKSIREISYEILLEEYCKNVVFCILWYKWSQEEFQKILSNIKWNWHLIDRLGKTVVIPKWIRGRLLPTRVLITESDIEKFSKQEYKKFVRTMIRNRVHTSDTKEEVFNLLKSI